MFGMTRQHRRRFSVQPPVTPPVVVPTDNGLPFGPIGPITRTTSTTNFGPTAPATSVPSTSNKPPATSSRSSTKMSSATPEAPTSPVSSPSPNSSPAANSSLSAASAPDAASTPPTGAASASSSSTTSSYSGTRSSTSASASKPSTNIESIVTSNPTHAAGPISSAPGVSSVTIPVDTPPTSASPPPALSSGSHAHNHAKVIVPVVLVLLALIAGFAALLWYCRQRRRRLAEAERAGLVRRDTTSGSRSVRSTGGSDEAPGSFYSLPSAGIFAAGMSTSDEGSRDSKDLDIRCVGRSESAASFAPREIAPVIFTAPYVSYAPVTPVARHAGMLSPPVAQHAMHVTHPAWTGLPSPTEWAPAPLPPPPRPLVARASAERAEPQQHRAPDMKHRSTPNLLHSSVPAVTVVYSRARASVQVGEIFHHPAHPGVPVALADPFGDDARVSPS